MTRNSVNDNISTKPFNQTKTLKIERINKMSENEKNREIVYEPAVREFDNNSTLITNIGFTAKSDTKYEILWQIPQTDEEAKERYDCELKDLITAGVRQLSTRPDYKSVGFNEDGTLKEDGHQAMQDLADGYKVGQRQVGVSQKATVQKVKKAEGELGMSLDEMVKKMAELKAQGMLD